MNIYLHELKVNFKFILIWTIIILLLSLLFMSLYPSISKDTDVFVKMFNNYPQSLRATFGLSNNTALGSALGYYSSFPLTLISLCGAIEAMILGLSVLSKEISGKTADFLLSKPVTRGHIVTSKSLAVITLLTASNIIILISFYLLFLVFSNLSFDFSIFILLTLIIFIIQLLFSALGLVISVILPKIKTTLPIAMGVTFGLYALSTFGDEKLRPLMPFKYFNTNYIINHGHYELNYFLLTIGIIIVSTIMTYLIYRNKDINAI